MDKEQELRLLPCPFCGWNEPKIVTNKHANMSWVACADCGLETPSETGTSAEDAAEYWNRRSSDEQAEVVGPWYCQTCGCQTHARCDERKPDGSFGPSAMVRCVNCKAVSVWPPAVAKGGVTDAVLDKAFADFVRGRDAAIDARPEVVDLNQVVRAGLRAALTAALAVGDEGSWQIKLIAEPDSGEAVNTYHATSPSGKVLTVFAANEAEAISFARRHRSPPSRGEGV